MLEKRMKVYRLHVRFEKRKPDFAAHLCEQGIGFDYREAGAGACSFLFTDSTDGVGNVLFPAWLPFVCQIDDRATVEIVGPV